MFNIKRFWDKDSGSAKEAKERLQIIIAHERSGCPSYDVEALQRDIIKVINEHMGVELVECDINIDNENGELDICIDLNKKEKIKEKKKK